MALATYLGMLGIEYLLEYVNFREKNLNNFATCSDFPDLLFRRLQAKKETELKDALHEYRAVGTRGAGGPLLQKISPIAMYILLILTYFVQHIHGT